MMTILKLFVLSSLVLGVSQSNTLAQNSASRLAQIINKLPCSTFEWVPWKDVSEKGAMKVPVKFGGKTYPRRESTGELEIGSMKLGRQLAFYRSEPLNFFKQFPFQTIGNVGNAPFFDKIIVMDLSPHPAFRILN